MYSVRNLSLEKSTHYTRQYREMIIRNVNPSLICYYERSLDAISKILRAIDIKENQGLIHLFDCLSGSLKKFYIQYHMMISVKNLLSMDSPSILNQQLLDIDDDQNFISNKDDYNFIQMMNTSIKKIR